jgi:hypothetical protein
VLSIKRPRFPEEFGLTELYKFRAYRTAEDKSHVREIIEQHKVWLSNAEQLNDPEDLRPEIKFRRGANDEETRKLLRVDAESVWARQDPPWTPEQLAMNRYRLHTERIDVLEREAMEKTHLRLNAEYWIFSLASSRDDVRMWDKYADERRGLCIHFRIAAGSPFRFAQLVLYQATSPQLLVPFGNLTGDQIGDACTRTKTLKWQGEAEYRLIRYPGQDVEYGDVGLRVVGRHGHFPPSAISGITVGTDMAKEDVESIGALARGHSPPLPVYRPRSLIVQPNAVRSRQ